MRRRSRSVGRPKKGTKSVVERIPETVANKVQRIMKSRALSKDEAWAYVLEKLSPIASPAGSDNEDDDGGGDSDGEPPPMRGKRVHEEEEEDDEPRVSEEELSNHVASIPSASDALGEAEADGHDARDKLVAQLKAEVARLKRKQYVTFVDVLRPKADSYCKLMTGLSQHAVRNLWDRYGCHFEDEQFGVAQPTPPQIVPTIAQEAAPRESDEGNSSSSRATRSEEEEFGQQGFVRRGEEAQFGTCRSILSGPSWFAHRRIAGVAWRALWCGAAVGFSILFAWNSSADGSFGDRFPCDPKC